MNLPVLFEDDRILAIDKPSGLPSHSLKDSERSCESLLKALRPPETVFLLHRLDTGTSGLLLFAKNKNTFNKMREQFKLKRIRKWYFAWSKRTPERDEKARSLALPFSISLPLAHHPKSARRMIALPEGKSRAYRGKAYPALTHLLQVTDSLFFEIQALRWDVEIVTGVTHQIRVHLQSLGFPLLGDAVYEKKLENETLQTRLALHARKISFSLDGQHYTIESSWQGA